MAEEKLNVEAQATPVGGSESLAGMPAERETRVKRPPMPRWQRWLREIVASILWMVAVLKLFVYDVDEWLVGRYFPSAQWVLHFRFAFFVGIAALVVLFWRRHILWRWFGYLLFFPLILALWRLPTWVVKRRSWTLIIALVAVGIGAVRSFKMNFLLICGYTLGTIVCAFGHAPWLLLFGALLLSLALLMTYWTTVAAAFRPTLEAFSTRTLGAIWRFIQNTYTLEECASGSLGRLPEERQQKWVTNLQVVILYNRACVFLANRLRDIKTSNLAVAAYIVRLLLLFLATVWTFFLLNLSTLKVFPSAYGVRGGVRGFDVFYYSFGTLFSNYTNDLHPTTVLSRSLAMSATVCMSLVFLVVVVFVVTSVVRSRDEGQIDATIVAIRRHAREVEPYLFTGHPSERGWGIAGVAAVYGPGGV